MAKINQELIERLIKELAVSRRAVYRRIHKVVGETMLELDQAALLLAMRQGINVRRYSTPDQREEVRRALANSPNPDPPPIVVTNTAARPSGARKTRPVKKVKTNKVFVVHGRDEELRKSMFDFLRALGLRPQEWTTAVRDAKKGANPYIEDILNAAMADAQAVVVLFSPDDLAQLKPHLCKRGEQRTEGKPQGQSRPNVLFEAGLALGAHPEKTLLAQVGKVRAFSDLAGKHLVRMSNEFDKRNDLANRLESIGCSVDRSGSDWTTIGNFVPTQPKAKKAKAPVKSA